MRPEGLLFRSVAGSLGHGRSRSTSGLRTGDPRCAELVTVRPASLVQSGMRHRILLHIVWTTRLRASLIDADGARFLCMTFRALAREHRAAILEIGMVSTHVHLLVRVHPLTNISTFVARMKGISSRVSKREQICPITWADGYNVESVSLGDEQKLRHYLRAQPYRHPEEAVPDWAGDTVALEAGNGLGIGA